MGDNHTTKFRAPRRRMSITAFGLAAAGVAAIGCGSDDGASGSGGSGAPGTSGLAIDIVTPSDGAETGDSFELAVDASVPFGEPDTGRHHLHVYYDGNTAEGEYDIVYGETIVIDDLDAGEHTIEAAIANADHSLAGASDTITVDVGSGPGTRGGSAPAPPTAPDYGY